MNCLKVRLDNVTPIEIPLKAVGKCYRNPNPTMELLCNVAKSGHTSVLEHIVFHFDISGVSRLLLQEFSRHRIASETVESTRFVLLKSIKELDTEKSSEVVIYFVIPDLFRKYPHLDIFYRKHIGMCIENIRHMSDMIRDLKDSGDIDHLEKISDYVKYMLPEGFRTNIYWTINLRSLINFIILRKSKNAHFEIRKLAGVIEKLVRENSQYGRILDVFDDVIPEDIDNTEEIL